MEKSELINSLSSSQNRRDEVANQILAKSIIASNDTNAVSWLMEVLLSGSAKIKKDCIKVVYEIGEERPSLIADHAISFLELLSSKDNRLQWGAMTALDCITLLRQEFIFKNLPRILDAAEKGSVITKDHAIEIMVKLGSLDEYNEQVVPILIEMLSKSAINQFPKYAESISSVVGEEYHSTFRKILSEKLDELDTDSKKSRVNRILKKLK